MLKLKNITKEYKTGDSSVTALRGVNIEFRKSEFVAILGQSGCGKTTLLNIIGGLDQYTAGDLIIGGRSTKEFNDADWDTYRNHSIGFVFQSYNLIPHQTVLANVELALTLSGVPKQVRRRKAEEALRRVGLGDQLNKKPNQMSGGQMQRVAIARALVNDPEILLADEPTGALDSATSVQIMEILREISKDKLIIMVTHNPELAEKYATRTIRLFDGKVTDDSSPYQGEETRVLAKKEQKKIKKTSMSFLTALSLSMNNLMTKKARTFLTSFAGSIGIIGIALILSLSNGINLFINRVQEDTLSSYPILLQAESVDMTSLVTSMMNATDPDSAQLSHELDAVYSNSVMANLLNSINSTEVTKNNLRSFYAYYQANREKFDPYLSAVQCSYNLGLNIYTTDSDGKIIKSDITALMTELQKAMGGSDSGMSSSMMSKSFSTYKVWEEMLPGKDGEPINDLLKQQYDVIYGNWPQAYNEIVLIVNDNNEVSDLVLFSLGLKTVEEMKDTIMATMGQGKADTTVDSWSYEDICAREFRMVLSSDLYQKNADGTYTDLSASDTGLDYLYRNEERSVPLKVVGILRPNDNAVASMMSGSIGYTTLLTDYVISESAEKEIIREQLEHKDTDVISGLPFKPEEEIKLTDAQKAEKVREYIASLSNAEKASLYTSVASRAPQDYLDQTVSQQLSALTREQIAAMIVQAYAESMGVSDTSEIEAYINNMTDEELINYASEALRKEVEKQYGEAVREQLGKLTTDQLAAMLDAEEFTETEYASIYDEFLPRSYSESTYDENLTLLGHVDREKPDSISLYASTFENKDKISDLISEYNKGVNEEDQITYTDYVKLMMSSITTIINAISYVLIAFVAVSLVVSSIMIGIITYISVLERTKEIGILRAIGASKRDISRVFNAETLLIGFTAGILGIGITLLLTIPINLIIHHLTGLMILNASLPEISAVLLVAISMFLTFIAGLIPSRIAARKDPVVALRTE